MKKTLVIGATVLDIIIQIHHLPKTSEDIHIQKQRMALGGCAYNSADILRKFKVPFDLISPIGTGQYAMIVENMLKERGIKSPVKLDQGDNGFCLCMVEQDGERTFVVYHGVEYSFDQTWIEDSKREEYDSVYISGFEIEEKDGNKIIDFIEDNNDYTVFFAPGPRLSKIGEDKLNRIFMRNPIVHLNEDEAMELSGVNTYEEAARIISERTRNTVIITLGSRGAYCYELGYGKLILGNKAEVVDTIGAGDSHIGAIMACLKQGKTLEQSVEVANKVSAAVVSVQGASLTEEQFIQAMK